MIDLAKILISNILSICFFIIFTRTQQIYKQIFSMQQAKINNQFNSAQIIGRNFCGNVENKGNLLHLDVTQFKKGALYTYQITNVALEKEYRRFLIFRKIDDLFDELASNQNLEVSDENTLIIPISVTYRSKVFQLRVEVPLINRKFNSQSEKIQNLFQQMQKFSQQKIKSTPYPINFRADNTNQKFNNFEIYDNGKKIKMFGTNTHTTLNNFQPLKKNGIFYFKVKIIKTAAKHILLGVCGNQIKSAVNGIALHSPYFIGLYLHNGALYGNNKNPIMAYGYTIVDGQSIFKIEIDMNKKWLTWFHNDVLLCSAQIWKELAAVDIYPLVNLYNNGDIVEILDK